MKVSDDLWVYIKDSEKRRRHLFSEAQMSAALLGYEGYEVPTFMRKYKAGKINKLEHDSELDLWVNKERSRG